MSVTNDQAESSLRGWLRANNYEVSKRREYGENGVDILASRGREILHIEVIGYSSKPSKRAMDFFQAFFRAVSRLKDGASTCVIAMPAEYAAMHFILAAAQYNTFEIGPQLTRYSKLPVLQFDHWSSDNKDFWVLLRTISGVLFYGFATLGSIVVLISIGIAGRFKLGFVPALAFVAVVGVVSFSIIVGATSFRVANTFGEPKKRILRRKTLYWWTIILTILLYLIFAWLINLS